MRKKGVLLSGKRTADQRLSFHYIDSTISLLPKSKFQASGPFCDCTVRFFSDLVGNPKDRFSATQLLIIKSYDLGIIFKNST